MKFRLLYSKEALNDKPAVFDSKYQRFSSYSEAMVSLVDFANILSLGHYWRNAIYNQPRFLEKHVESAQIVALDFDDTRYDLEFAIDEAHARVGVRPNLGYYSYSHAEGNPRYRVIWVLDKPLPPHKWVPLYNWIFNRMGQFRPDPAARNIGRLWFGGIHAEIYNYEFMKTEEFIEKHQILTQIKESKAPKKLCEELDVQVELSSAKLRDLRAHCILWDRWVKGEYLNRAQRFILITGLKGTGLSAEEILQVSNPSAYENSLGYGIDEIEGWLFDEKTQPQRIVKYSGREMTVAEYFKHYYVEDLF